MSDYDSCSFEEKLIYALRHPVRENRMMAVQLLGEMKSEKAVTAFASILESEKDFYVIREVINSLKKTGTPEGIRLIQKQGSHPSKLVRKLVWQVIGAHNEQ